MEVRPAIVLDLPRTDPVSGGPRRDQGGRLLTGCLYIDMVVSISGITTTSSSSVAKAPLPDLTNA